MENITYLFNASSTFIQRVCYSLDGARLQTVECMNKLFCPQLNTYFIKTGIGLIFATIVLTIIADKFVKKWYKYIKLPNEPKWLINFIGDLNNENTRLWWRVHILDTMNAIMMFYVMLVVWLNI